MPGTPPPARSAAATPRAPAAPVDDAGSGPVVTAEPTPPFALPAYAPPFERTAKEGDGEWKPLHGLRGAPSPSPILESTVHPHSFKKFVFVTIAAMDLAQVDVHLVAGTHEPTSKKVPREQRPGLVSPEHLDDLLVVFNGGFQAQHGRYGMRVGDLTFIAPRPENCTVALRRDGSLVIDLWSRLEAQDGELAAYRQTPPCLLEQGKPHPELRTIQSSRRWGRSVKGEAEVRRSAIGLDESGRVVFFGIGEWVTAKDLAVAMKAAGAVSAAQLDINWSYTRFLMFDAVGDDGQLEVVDTLIPELKHSKTGYVARPSYRDFFYVTREARDAREAR